MDTFSRPQLPGELRGDPEEYWRNKEILQRLASESVPVVFNGSGEPGSNNDYTLPGGGVMEHTRGPWVTGLNEDSPSGGLLGIWNTDHTKLIAGVVWGGESGVSKEEAQANAALIQASPTLLEMMRMKP